MGKTIDDTTDIDIVLPGDAAAATRPELPAWAEYGVSQIFHTFNSRHDGVLCLQDMNHLQAALGNTTPYTLREYRALCNTHSLTWHWIRDPGVPPDLAGDSMPVSLLVTPTWAQSDSSKPQGGLDGGLDANGLIALYAQMGADCVKRDLALLGIMPGVWLRVCVYGCVCVYVRLCVRACACVTLVACLTLTCAQMCGAKRFVPSRGLQSGCSGCTPSCVQLMPTT